MSETNNSNYSLGLTNGLIMGFIGGLLLSNSKKSARPSHTKKRKRHKNPALTLMPKKGKPNRG